MVYVSVNGTHDTAWLHIYYWHIQLHSLRTKLTVNGVCRMDSDTTENEGTRNDDQATLPQASENVKPEQTFQEKIHNLYTSENMKETTVGYGVKFATEFTIVTIWMTIFVLSPGLVLAWLQIGPLSYSGVTFTWLGFSATATLSSWCFTGATDGESEDESESQS